jgi:molecular chaperone GrpE
MDFRDRVPRDDRGRATRIPVNRPGGDRTNAADAQEQGTGAAAAEALPAASEQPETEATPVPAEAWKEKYLRLAAELENNKRQTAKRYANQAEQAQAKLIRDLLPLVDNLQRALTHANPRQTDIALYNGIELSLRQFIEALAKHGVTPIDALGKPFDPALHEAVAAVSVPGEPSGTIVRVEEPGYMYNERLLRPARVVVVA